jgi:hypothetical protein
MFQPAFESETNSYSYESETNQFRLLDKKSNFRIILRGYDASLFRKHLELITGEPEGRTKRIEKAINIFFYFKTNPCPVPNFIE